MKPTEETINDYKKDFGDDFFSFWLGGVKFIALNSQYFFDATQVPKLKEEQEEWLNKELEKDKWKHLVIFQHIPWFLNNAHEEFDGKFNLDKLERNKWLEKFKKAGVSKIFCGHYHRNAGGFYDDVEVIVTSAIGAQLGNDKHGYRLIEVNENEIKHQYITITDSVN